MVFVQGGCFDMGDNFNEGDSDELPAHRVCLDDFYMDAYEVTQNAYENVMGNNPSLFKSCGGDCPVEEVTWYEADGYCRSVGKRLPTEAEWEYVAREGGRVVRYGTGKNTISCGDAQFSGCAGNTVPVGSFALNVLGLYGMSGNVWEWVADRYDSDYYDVSLENNPTGPSFGTYRVLRGGSWTYRAPCAPPIASGTRLPNATTFSAFVAPSNSFYPLAFLHLYPIARPR